MSEMTAKVTKGTKGADIQVEGFEALKYHFHYDSPVFDTKNEKLAKIYERWQRVLIVIDTSKSILAISVIVVGTGLTRSYAFRATSDPTARSF
jgi:hypothetical protein